MKHNYNLLWIITQIYYTMNLNKFKFNANRLNNYLYNRNFTLIHKYIDINIFIIIVVTSFAYLSGYLDSPYVLLSQLHAFVPHL